jgi:hypothetical protein
MLDAGYSIRNQAIGIGGLIPGKGRFFRKTICRGRFSLANKPFIGEMCLLCEYNLY